MFASEVQIEVSFHGGFRGARHDRRTSDRLSAAAAGCLCAKRSFELASTGKDGSRNMAHFDGFPGW